MTSSVSSIETVIQQTLAELKSGPFRKSGFLNVQEFEAILRPAIEEVTSLIDRQDAGHPDLVANDLYLEELVSIIRPRIGKEQTTEEMKSRWHKAQLRLDAAQPPGYRDAKKPATGTVR